MWGRPCHQLLQQLPLHSPPWSRGITVRCYSTFSQSTRSRSHRGTREWSQTPQHQQGWHQQQQPRQQHRRQQQKQAEHHSHEQFTHQYLITCHPGLEEVTAADLRQCCSHAAVHSDVEVIAPGRVSMGANSLAAGYAAVMHLRSATRVLQLIHQQDLDPDAPAGQTVYDATRAAADWSGLLQPQQTLAVHCLHFYNNSNVTNSQLVQRRVRDAVCDAVRDDRGVRPAPPEGQPDLPLVFQMLSDRLQLFRDLGGGSLHRRGYRADAAVHRAALNEAAAAGLLLLAGWQHICLEPGVVQADPMCGSGTLLIEAALMATQSAPGLLRDTASNPWPLMHWPDFQEQQWAAVVQLAQQRMQEGTAAWQAKGGQLLGNDCHAGAVKLARQAAKAAGVSQLIQFHQGMCGDWVLQQQPNLVLVNPPWGLRLLPEDGRQQYQQQRQQQQYRRQPTGRDARLSFSIPADEQEDADALAETWGQLSHFLKTQCPGAEAWVLSGNPEATRHLGMRSCKKRSVSIGGQKTAWIKYEVRRA